MHITRVSELPSRVKGKSYTAPLNLAYSFWGIKVVQGQSLQQHYLWEYGLHDFGRVFFYSNTHP